MSTCLIKIFILLLLSNFISAQNNLIPDVLRTDILFNSVSFNYSISGDDNLNSTMEIRYKEVTESSFKPGAMTMRAHPGLIIDGASSSMNFHAGAIMLLEAGTVYDVEIVLTDPDGGDNLSTFQVITKTIPEPSINAKLKYVAPGNGGGSGSQADPYLGLQEAADNAQAGDHFIVAPGSYNDFTLLNSGTSTDPISFISEVQHAAIINGGNTDRGVMTLGEFDQSISDIIVDGFVIENGKWAIDAQNSQFITVRNNIIRDVDYGYLNRRQNGLDNNQYIINNLITGRTVWPGTGIPSERGIDVRGTQNVISYNTLKNFGDGIATDGPPQQTIYTIEIHNNDISNMVDDLIEVDFVVSNAIVYENRCYNGRAGVSLAPIYGGPAYIFRNVLYNLEISSFKMNRGPSGLVIVHNTAVSEGNGLESPNGWQNTYFRNNVILGSRYCFELYGLTNGSKDDWDYGTYYSSRTGSSGSEWFKWNNVRYATVPVLQNSGLLEANAIDVSLSDFVNLSLPENFDVEYQSNDFNVLPLGGSPMIDNGEILNHINEHFVLDGAPDRGALEVGQGPVRYGHIFDLGTHIELSDNCIQIFPNPFTDKVILKGEFSNFLIQIFDAAGNLVGDYTGTSSPFQIDLNYLGSGMYFINVQSIIDNDLFVYKIIKE